MRWEAVASQMNHNDRDLLGRFRRLGTPAQTRVLKGFQRDKALRDVATQLSVERIEETFEYTPTSLLCHPLRSALTRLVAGAEELAEAEEGEL